MIFLDQPVNVGYSYGDTSVDTSPVVGQDVYAFMELFLNRFPKYADKPFHLAAESYGGAGCHNSSELSVNSAVSRYICAPHRQRHLSQEQGIRAGSYPGVEKDSPGVPYPCQWHDGQLYSARKRA